MNDQFIAQSPPSLAIGYTISDQGEWRSYQEDRSVYSMWYDNGNKIHLNAIMDGHAGSHIVSRVCEVLPLIIKNYTQDISFISSSQLVEKIDSACNTIQEILKQEDKRFHDQGTTLNAILKVKTKIICINSGDSRAILCWYPNSNVLGFENLYIPLSSDHKPSSLMEQQRIYSLGGCVSPSYIGSDILRVWHSLNNRSKGPGLSVSRGFGDFHGAPLITHRPEVVIYDIERDNPNTDIYNNAFIVIASDGLWDVVSSDEVCSWGSHIYRNWLYDHSDNTVHPSQQLSYVLLRTARQRHSQDNVTISVLNLFSTNIKQK